jgi:hypothetical protein
MEARCEGGYCGEVVDTSFNDKTTLTQSVPLPLQRSYLVQYRGRVARHGHRMMLHQRIGAAPLATSGEPHSPAAVSSQQLTIARITALTPTTVRSIIPVSLLLSRLTP